MMKLQPVLSGVSQISVLGPLLFNIYVNDMPIAVNSSVLQFTDDFKMSRVIKGAQDFQELQIDIDKLLAWANKWQLRFNVSKCYVLHLGPPHAYSEYSMQGTIISSSDHDTIIPSKTFAFILIAILNFIYIYYISVYFQS